MTDTMGRIMREIDACSRDIGVGMGVVPQQGPKERKPTYRVYAGELRDPMWINQTPVDEAGAITVIRAFVAGLTFKERA